MGAGYQQDAYHNINVNRKQNAFPENEEHTAKGKCPIFHMSTYDCAEINLSDIMKLLTMTS